MSLNNIDFLINLLKEIGVHFDQKENFINTYWIDSKKKKNSILIFVNDNWINFTAEIDKTQIKKTEKELLKNNFRYLGLKLALKQENELYLIYQVPINNIDGTFLKTIFKLYLQAINDLYYS